MFYFTKEACEHLNHVLTLSYGKCMAVVRTVTFCFTSVIHKITEGALNVQSEYEYNSFEYYTKEKQEEATVLQVCIFGDDYMLAEYVFNKDMK